MLRFLVCVSLLTSCVWAADFNPIDLFEVDESGNISIRHRVDDESYYIIRLYDRTSQKLEIDSITLGDGASGVFNFPTALGSGEPFLFGVDEVPLVAPLDSDGDGIDDYFELTTTGFSAMDAVDASLDFDDDGSSNYLEYLLNSDPNDFSPLPVALDELMPEDGEDMVNVTRETIVRFSGKVDPASVTTDSFYLTLDGEKVAGRIIVSSTKKFATFFYDTPLPPSSQVTVHLNGNLIRDENGLQVDVDNDFFPGGEITSVFRTLPVYLDVGTNVFGYVKDAMTQEAIEGVTVRLSAFPDVTGISDNTGRFELESVPSPEFFVDIDGSTVQGLPDGIMYPIVGKMFHSVSGQTTQLSQDGQPFDIYLPQMSISDFKPLDENLDTEIGFGSFGLQEIARILPDLDPAVFARVKLTIPAGSAYQDDGTPGTLAAIVPVPPDRLPAPLPEGINPKLVISVQAGAAGNFDVPAPITFPNLDNLPPGSKATLWSFSHDAGQFMPVGNMTVSEDGLSVSTDAGVGVLAPGWHFTTEPRHWAGAREPFLAEGDLVERVIFTRSGERFKFELPSFDPPLRYPVNDTQRPHLRVKPRHTVLVTIDGKFEDFYENEGENGLKEGNYYIFEKDKPLELSANLRLTEDIFERANKGKPLISNALLGAVISVKSRNRNAVGDVTVKNYKYYVYHLIDNADDDRNDGILKLPEIVKGKTIREIIENRLNGVESPELYFEEPSDSRWSINQGGGWTIRYTPDDETERSAKLFLKIDTEDGEVKQEMATFRGKGRGKTIIYFDKSKFIDTHITTVQGETDTANASFRDIADSAFQRAFNVTANHFNAMSPDISSAIGYSPSADNTSEPRRILVKWSQTSNEYIDHNGNGDPDFGTEVANFQKEGQQKGVLDVPGDFIDFNENGVFDAGDVSKSGAFGDGNVDTPTVPGEFIDANGDGVFSESNDLGLASSVDMNFDLFVSKLATEEARKKLSPSQIEYLFASAFDLIPTGEINLYVNGMVGYFNDIDGASNATPEDKQDRVGDVIAHEIAHTLGLVHSNNMMLGPRDNMAVTHGGGILSFKRVSQLAALAGLKAEFPREGLSLTAVPAYALAHANPAPKAGNVFKATASTGCRTCEYYAQLFSPQNTSGLDTSAALSAISKDDDSPPLALLMNPAIDEPLRDADPYAAADDWTVTLGTSIADGVGGERLVFEAELVNGGASTLVVDSATLAGGEDSPFSVEGIEAGLELEPSEGVLFLIIFDPLASGAFEDSLYLATNAEPSTLVDDTGIFDITVKARGLSNQPELQVEFLDGNNNLGGVELGDSKEWDLVTVTNAGGLPLVYTPSVSAGQLDFSIGSSQGVEVTLQPEESASIPVVYTPGSLGLARASLQFSSNDPGQSEVAFTLVGTGLPEGGIGNGDFDWGNDYIYTKTGNFAQRAVSSFSGEIMLDLAANSPFEVRYFDPVSGYFGRATGTAGEAAGFTDITGGLFLRASGAPDSDGDGLPDDIELTMGTSSLDRDSDGDGVDDFLEVTTGLDPLDGIADPAGFRGSIELAGDSRIVETATLRAGETEIDLALAPYVSTLTSPNEHGVSIVDISDPRLPVYLRTFGMGFGPDFEIVDIEASGEQAIMALITNDGALSVYDISNPLEPELIGSQTELAITDITIYRDRIFAADGERSFRIFDHAGLLIDTVPVLGQVDFLTAAGGYLYVSGDDISSRFTVFDIGDVAAPRQVGSLSDRRGKPLDAGNGIIAMSNPSSDTGIGFVDVSDPTDPQLIFSGVGSIPNFGMAVNGSGLALVTGTNVGVQVVDYSDPETSIDLVGVYPFPDRAFGVSILDGVAVVTGQGPNFDKRSILRTLNYLDLDTSGVDPMVMISTSLTDLEPGVEGIQVLSGTRVPLQLDVTDDVQIKRTESLVDGRLYQIDNKPPFRFDSPVSDTSTMRLQARAIDTGLNVGLSNELLIEFVEDTYLPTLQGQSLASGANVFSPNEIVFYFSEQLDPEAIDPTRAVLWNLGADSVRGGGDDSVFPLESVELAGSGSRLVIRPNGEAPDGDYELAIDAEMLRDLAGNVIAEDIVVPFSITPPAPEYFAASGTPANVSAPSANAGQLVPFSAPMDPRVLAFNWPTVASWGTQSVSTYNVDPFNDEIDDDNNTVLFEVPSSAVTGEITIFGSVQFAPNLNELIKWNLESGLIRIVGEDSQGGESGNIFPGNGVSVQWPGGNYDGALMKTKLPIDLSPGSYRFTADLGGPTDGFDLGDPKSIVISLGTLFSETVDRDWSGPLEKYTKTFDVATAESVYLTVEDLTEDQEYSGIIMDNFKIERVSDDAVMFEDDFSLAALDESFLMQIVPTVTTSAMEDNLEWEGSEIVVKGSGFIEGALTVHFGDVSIEDTELESGPDVTDTSTSRRNEILTLDVPLGASYGSISVSTAGGESEPLAVEITEIVAVAENGVPENLEEASANRNQVITIRGSGFTLGGAPSGMVFFLSRSTDVQRSVRTLSVNEDGTEATIRVPGDAVTGSVNAPGLSSEGPVLQIVIP